MPIAAPLPENETERLNALRAFDVLDTPPEAAFDRITALASQICGAPIALVSLVDRDRQWFKSRCGLDAQETPRELAFCAHAILGDDAFVIPDATADARFKDSPLVLGPPHIRSYAGIPLTTRNGFKLGTLCVIHDAVTHLSELQITQLQSLAAMVVDELELRSALKETQIARDQMEARSAELLFLNDTLEDQARQLVEMAEEREELYLSNEHNRRFIQTLMSTVPIPIFSFDAGERFTHVNAAYGALIGVEASQIPGKHLGQLFSPEFAQNVHEQNERLIADPGGYQSYEVKLPKLEKDETRDVIVNKAVIRTNDGSVDGIVGALIDVTEQKALQKRLELLATTDPLTGAYNRRAFIEQANDELQRYRRYGNPMSLIMIDLDRFKAVNDTYGHQAGDDVLRLVVKVCAEAIRDSIDILARLGGEEFAILVPETDSAGAAALAERLRATIAEQELEIEGGKITFTASLGVVTVNEKTAFGDLDAVLTSADECLYASKDGGRNCVTVFDREAARPSSALQETG